MFTSSDANTSTTRLLSPVLFTIIVEVVLEGYYNAMQTRQYYYSDIKKAEQYERDRK